MDATRILPKSVIFYNNRLFSLLQIRLIQVINILPEKKFKTFFRHIYNLLTSTFAYKVK